MKRFLNLITRKFYNCDSFIEDYRSLNLKLSSLVENYDEGIKSGTIKKYLNSDLTLTNGLKEAYQEIILIGLKIENLIEAWIENDDDDWKSKYGDKIPKHSSIKFSDDLLNVSDSKSRRVLEIFPECLEYDPDIYNAFIQINNQILKIENVEKIIEEMKLKEVNYSLFEKLLLVHKQNLIELKLRYSSLLLETKISLDKTLNFISLPVEVNIETVFIHSYFLNLVKLGFLNNRHFFKRYCYNKPNVVSPYLEELGFYFVKEDSLGSTIELNSHLPF